jgi:ABC-type transport system substrate-binding protein
LLLLGSLVGDETGGLEVKEFGKAPLLVVLILCASLILTACGSSTPTTAPAATTAVAQAPATAPQATTAPAVSATTTAPAPATTAPAVTSGHPGVYREAWFGPDPATLDPQASQPAGYTTRFMYGNLYIGLTTYDEKANVVPGIAKEWKASPDSRTWTFSLNPAAKFSSGRQVTANDVAFSFERALDPKLKNAQATGALGDIDGAMAKFGGQAEKIAGINVVDETTLELKLTLPTAFLPTKLAISNAYILDKNIVEANPKWWETKSAGAGPFQLSEWLHNQKIVLSPNPGWHGNKVKLQKVEYLMVGDQTNRLNLFESGQTDTHWQLLTAEIERLSKDKGDLGKSFKQYPQGFGFTFYMGMNGNAYEPFKDAKVRKAISMALDSAAINEVPLNGAGIQATGLVSNGMPGFKPNQMTTKFDVAGAKKLLAEAGFSDPSKMPELTLTQVGSGPDAAGTAQYIQQALKTDLGLNVKIEVVDQAQFQGLLRQNKVASWTTLMIAGYTDPYAMLSNFHSKSPFNTFGYNNPEVDALLGRALATQDNTARYQLYNQIEAKVLEDAVVMPVMWAKFYYLERPWVSGYKVNVLGIMPFTDVEVK